MFHGNIARTGSYESPGPKQLSGVLWTFKTNGPVLASPSIANGVLFIGSADGSFHAIDQKTGKEIWKFETQGQIASSAAIVGGIVYFSSYDGTFYALDAATGTPKWRFAMDYERRFEIQGLHGISPKHQTIPEPWDFFTSSPAVIDDHVYFGGGDGNVYALNAGSGTLLWKFATGNVVHTSPAVVQNTVYVGSWNSNLYALDAITGKEKWRFEAGRDPEIHNQEGFTSSPAVVNGVVYVGCRDSHVYALDAFTGAKKWDFSTKGAWVSATPAVRDRRLYVTTGASDEFPARLVALDTQTGESRFLFDIKTGGFSSAVVSADMVYVGNTNGRLYAVDSKSGKLVWQFQTENAKKDAFDVLNQDGSFKDRLTNFTFYDFQDRYVWMYKRFSVGAIVSSPVLDQGNIYFGSTDGFVYALH